MKKLINKRVVAVVLGIAAIVLAGVIITRHYTSPYEKVQLMLYDNLKGEWVIPDHLEPGKTYIAEISDHKNVLLLYDNIKGGYVLPKSYSKKTYNIKVKTIQKSTPKPTSLASTPHTGECEACKKHFSEQKPIPTPTPVDPKSTNQTNVN